MKIIEPKVELWSEENSTPEEHIARCAAVCYNSHPKDPQKLCSGLRTSKHYSMFRHSTRYFLADYGKIVDPDELEIYPYFTAYHDEENGEMYFSVNEQEAMNGETAPLLNNQRGYKKYEISNSDVLNAAAKYDWNIFQVYRLTFCLTTQISTSRELNRVSPNNIAERSTRYCSSKDGLTICKPWWWNDEHYHIGEPVIQFAPYKHPEEPVVCAWEQAEWSYDDLLRIGMKPEDARGVLPLDTATRVVYTYSVKEWQHILDLRYYGKTSRPHPNAKLIMGMVRDKINQFAKEHNIDYEV